MTVSISIEDEAWNEITHLEALAFDAVKAVFAAEQRDCKLFEVSIRFASDAAIRELNSAWRGKNAPTNVLSFPSPPGLPSPPGEPALIGDIVLGAGTVATEAKQQGKLVTAHVSHLIVHGTMHLLGYDHETDADAEAMEAQETVILAALGIADPYGPNQLL